MQDAWGLSLVVLPCTQLLGSMRRRSILQHTYCRVYSLFNLGTHFSAIEVVSSPSWKRVAFRLFLYPVLAQEGRSRKAVLWSWNLLPWAKDSCSVQSALLWKEAWQAGAWHRLATSSQRAGSCRAHSLSRENVAAHCFISCWGVWSLKDCTW